MHVISTEIESEKKKAEEPKDTMVPVALQSQSNPIPLISTTLLLPSSPQTQVVDIGDGESKESESIELDKAVKKTSDVENISE